MKQRTLLRDVSIQGKGLHTGEAVRLTLRPAPVNTGYLFRRVDLYGKPEVPARALAVDGDLIRQTSLTSEHAQVHTPEHVLSALAGCGVDNCILELEGSEVPILDGSARPFATLLQDAEATEQEEERTPYVLDQAVSVHEGNRSLIALPHDGFKITCTSADDRGIHTQHLSLEITPEQYIAQVAPARTFTIYEDIEALLKMGKIQGGSLDSAIVIKGDKIISKEPLRFKDEFVRHKIVDLVGDLALLGRPLKAHVIAVRPGHKLNNRLARALFERMEEPRQAPAKRKAKAAAPETLRQVQPDETTLDIRRVLDVIPHRFPFVMIDRVLKIGEEDEVVALKNVTYNEPYFLGHFPGHPVMPGVLQLEAMAQAAGILMLKRVSSEGRLAFFMSADKVKFRRGVVPGDAIEIHAKLTKNRGNKLCAAKCECRVAGKVVSSAELMFTILEAEAEL